MSSSTEESRFERWLRAYGATWEARDSGAFASLFSDDADYHWTPFGEPKKGPRGIAEAFGQAVANQRDVRFSWQVLSDGEARGLAHWHAVFNRATTGAEVHVDGVLSAEWAEDGRCRVFREWWHSDEQG